TAVEVVQVEHVGARGWQVEQAPRAGVVEVLQAPIAVDDCATRQAIQPETCLTRATHTANERSSASIERTEGVRRRSFGDAQDARIVRRALADGKPGVV